MCKPGPEGPTSIGENNSFEGHNECFRRKTLHQWYVPYTLLTNTLSLDKSSVFLVMKFIKNLLYSCAIVGLCRIRFYFKLVVLNIHVPVIVSLKFLKCLVLLIMQIIV